MDDRQPRRPPDTSFMPTAIIAVVAVIVVMVSTTSGITSFPSPGSILSNLDPFGEHAEPLVWAALRRSALADKVRRRAEAASALFSLSSFPASHPLTRAPPP